MKLEISKKTDIVKFEYLFIKIRRHIIHVGYNDEYNV